MELKGKVAIVTEAASGIGYATDKLMASYGAKVIAADINFDRVQKVVEEIISTGGVATATYLDVLEEATIKEMMAKAKEAYGKIDILHNNTGATRPEDHKVADIDVETWDLA